MSRTWTLIGCLVDATPSMKYLQLAVGYTLLVIIFFLGFAILVGIWRGKIDLSLLLTESGGGASMSRFQLLVFTFVIGLSLFFIVAAKGEFPSIPKEVLTLLGISATTYGVSKGIQAGGGLDNKDGSAGGDGGGGNGHGGADGGAGGGGAAGHN